MYTKRFKELREEKGITIEQLAQEIDVHINIINSIENGYSAPIYVLKKYAIYFDVTADYLIELTDDRKGFYR